MCAFITFAVHDADDRLAQEQIYAKRRWHNCSRLANGSHSLLGWLGKHDYANRRAQFIRAKPGMDLNLALAMFAH